MQRYAYTPKGTKPSFSSPFIGIDTETVSLDDLTCLGVGIALSDEEAIFVQPDDPLVEQVIGQASLKVFHNARFDLKALKMPASLKYEDTWLLAGCNGELDTSLRWLSAKYLGVIDFPAVTDLWQKKQKTNEGVSMEALAPICCQHAMFTRRLYKALPDNEAYREIELPFQPLLTEMEANGLYIDQAELSRQESSLVERAQQLASELPPSLRGINLNSPQQVGQALKSLGLPMRRKTPTGKVSTSKAYLSTMSHPAVAKLLEYRSVCKALSTYIENFKGNDRVHTHYGYTETGRLRSYDFNLQNLTNGGLRRIIAAPEGYCLLCLDANQIELRVAAVMSQDREMLRMLSAEDMHLATALAIWNDAGRRMEAKKYNFAILYGAGAEKAAELTGQSLEEASAGLDQYFARFPRLKAWLEEQEAFAITNGYCINAFGRKRTLPNVLVRQSLEAGLRQAVNMPLQSSAVDIVKQMMTMLRRILPADVRLLHQVHDEVIFELPVEILVRTVSLCQEALSDCFPLYPVTAKHGSNYADLTA